MKTEKILNKGEQAFAEKMQAEGKKIIFQPYLREIKLRPDFYCVDDDIYYEVISTRQAYHLRKEKIKKAIDKGIKIKVVKPDGSPYPLTCREYGKARDEERVFLRISEREKKEAEKEAAKKGLTLSAYIRMLLYEQILALRDKKDISHRKLPKHPTL